MYESSHITEVNLDDWHIESECPLLQQPVETPEPEDVNQDQDENGLVQGLEMEPPIPFPILDPSWLESKQNESEDKVKWDLNERGQRLVRTDRWPYVEVHEEDRDK